MKNRIQLALAANQRYYPGLAVALCSALMHLRPDWAVDVIILDGGLEEGSKKQLVECSGEIRDNVKINFRAPDMSVFKDMPTDYGKSTMAYARLLLPSMFPEVGKVIYIDSDMIILRDLSEIWDHASASPIGATSDYFYETIASDCLAPVTEGLVDDLPYFNSGLMVMNLTLWREQRVVDRCLNYLQEHPDWCKWWDQSALNVILAGDWDRIDSKWNSFTREMTEYDIQKNYHYLTPTKPWLNFEESLGSHAFYEYSRMLGLNIDSEPDYRKSKRVARGAPFLLLWSVVCCGFWGIQLKRKPYRKSFKKLRYWRDSLKFRWLSPHRKLMSKAIEQDFTQKVKVNH